MTGNTQLDHSNTPISSCPELLHQVFSLFVQSYNRADKEDDSFSLFTISLLHNIHHVDITVALIKTKLQF